MKKILVTTDFSSNSKAGLRFAIQMAMQSECELHFFHSYHIMRPTSWSDQAFLEYENKEKAQILTRLERFVRDVYRSAGAVPGNVSYVAKSSFMTDSNIIQYASDNQFDFICISRRGEGKLKKLFGTNTSNLIINSPVPVIAVPDTYRRSEISKILYASDLVNLEQEMRRVIDFAGPLKAEIELLHLNYPLDTVYDSRVIMNVLDKFPQANIKYRVENLNQVRNFIKSLEPEVRKRKPSLLVMFTRKNQGFFNKLFFSGNSPEYAMKSPVPLLVFNKHAL